MRALRSAFTKRPSPGITKTPFFLVSLIAISLRFCRNVAAVLLLVSSFSASERTRAVLVIPDAMFASSGFLVRLASNGIAAHPKVKSVFASVYAGLLLVAKDTMLLG